MIDIRFSNIKLQSFFMKKNRNLYSALFKSGYQVFKRSIFVCSFFILCIVKFANAQSELMSDGPTSICVGEETTIQVIISASIGPYSITYNDGTTDFVVNGYSSNGDPESPEYGGDPIAISPTSTTIYSLVKVVDSFGSDLPVGSETVIINVNPLPSDIAIVLSPAAPVCPGVDFTISATATNGNVFELWDETKSNKLADLPTTTSIIASTNYFVKAISENNCESWQSLSVPLENISPEITCPEDQTINPAAGNCDASLPDYTGLVTVTDNCTSTGSISLMQTPTSGTILTGHNTSQVVRITATDEATNTSYCEFTVTVIDNEVPVISGTPEDISQSVTTGTCGSVVSWTEPTATDNCTSEENIIWSKSHTPGGTFPKGSTEVVYTATDQAGNVSTESKFTITIIDNELPKITCPTSIEVANELGSCDKTISLTDISYSDNCPGANISWIMIGAVSDAGSGQIGSYTFPVGTTTITYTVTDAASPANTAECSYTVTVNDSEDPVIVNLPSDIEENNEDSSCGKIVNWTEPSVSDNCLGATISQTSGLSNGAVFPVGQSTVTYTATDAEGNTHTESFTVTINDIKAPTFIEPSDITVSSDINSCEASIGVPELSTDDNCGTETISWEMTGAISQSGSGQIGTFSFPVGETTITYTVADGATPANTVQADFVVVVKDEQNPTLTTPSPISANTDVGECTASIDIPAAIYDDNCSGSTLSWTMSGAVLDSGNGDIGTYEFPVGSTSITYTVTDSSTPANTTQTSFVVEVTDSEKPIISGCVTNIVRTSDENECTANVSWTEPTATDNCTSASNIIWTKSHNPGSNFDVGTTTVTYTARDEAGNLSDVCSFTVTVTDNQKPVLNNCPEDILVSTDIGSCSAIVSWTEPTVTDNCTSIPESFVWSKSKSPGDDFPVGTTTVSYTVADEYGNESLPCTFKVTVEDDVSPSASLKNTTIYLNDQGIATLSSADIDDGSTDNCTSAGNLIFTFSKTSFTCADKGEHSITVTVKDLTGNVSSEVVTVTVADFTPPVLSTTTGTQTSEVNTNSGDCFYTVNGSEFDPIVTDNCGSVTASFTVTGATTLSGTGTLSGEQLNSGANIITWTAVDISGNNVAEPMVFTKTVVDSQAPSISAKSNQTRGTDTDCGYTAKNGEFDVTVTDNCGTPSLSYSINGGASVAAASLDGVVLELGTNTVKWTAESGGQTSTRTFKVEVKDDDSPVIPLITDITSNVDAGKCTAEISWSTPAASDNCTLVSFSQILGPVSGSEFPVGTTAIRYKAVDAADNITFMGFNITVVDETAPELSCPAEVGSPSNPLVRYSDDGTCFYTVESTEFDVTVSDGCSFLLMNSFDNSSTLNGKQLPVGDHTLVWTATDNDDNVSTCTIYVRIADEQFPTYNQPTGDIADTYEYERSTDPGQCYFTIPGTEFDLSNIVDNCDYDTPTYVITQGGSTVYSDSNSLANLQLPKSEVPYIVTWTLADISGNTVIATPFQITVGDDQAPSFECYGNEIRSIPPGSCDYTIDGAEFDPVNLLDNCDSNGELTISYQIDGVSGGAATSLDGIVLSGGQYQIEWIVKDLSDNADTCTFNIHVLDDVFPTISTITDQTRNAPTDDCFYQAITTEFDPTISDNCPGVSLVNNLNGTATLADYQFPVGITVVVWTATDAAGNKTIMQFQVDVEDVTAPDYSISTLNNKSTDANRCYYTAQGNEFDPQSITDNCTSSNYIVLNDHNDYKSLDGVQFPIGTTTVEWSVKDNYGNEKKETIQIIVSDDSAPSIVCPSESYVRVVDEGQNYYTVGASEFKPIVSDNCSVSSYTNNITGTSSIVGEQLIPGNHDIVWTATDPSSNVQTCTIPVLVVTDLYPVITCVSNQSRPTDSGVCTYTVSGTEFDASSFGTGVTLINDYNNSSTLDGAVFDEGTTLVKWTASIEVGGQTYQNSCSFYVFVNDNEDPVITPQPNLTIEITSGCYAYSVDLGTPTRTDNCGVLSYWSNAPSRYPIGTTDVTWRIEDVHDNISTSIQQVTVIDKTLPSIVCPGDFCRQEDDGLGYYTVNGHEFDAYGAWDCSGISSVINDFNNSSTLNDVQFPVGTHTVIWTITDNATPTQNIRTCTSIITINSDDPPSVTCRGNATKSTDEGVCYYTVQGDEFDVISSTNPDPTLTYSVTGATTLSGLSLAGEQLNKGTNTITWVADAGGGNTNECCSFIVYVRDYEVPQVTWPSDVSFYVDGACTKTVLDADLGNPTATDNCEDPAEIDYDRTPSGNTFSIGETNIYWTAEDERGNLVTHTQKVTVVDNISPVIDCPSQHYYREYDHEYVDYYTVVGSEFTPDVTENCILSSYTNDKNNSRYLNGFQLGLGDHAIIWTATDASSNTDQCIVNVTVVESFHPEIACPGIAYKNTGSSSCTYTVVGSELDAQFTSETIIDGRTLTHDLAGTPSSTTLAGAEIPKGTNTITWTAAQTIGGVEYISTCSHQVIVTDNVNPVITPPDDISVFVDDGTCTATMTLDDPIVTDNCGTVTITNNAPDPFLLGINKVIWVVTDESGNKSTYIQNVTVVDDEAPVISNCPSEVLSAESSGSNCQAIVSWPPLVATDDCSGVKSFTSTHLPGSFFDVGTTTVTYTATDNNDNVSTCSFDVIVTDEDPEITCVNNQERVANAGKCSYLVLGNELDPLVFSDNCQISSVTWSFVDGDTGLTRTGTNSLSGVEIPRGDDPGIVQITWTATDNNDNAYDCTFNLTILDEEAPIIVVPGNQVRSVDTDKNYYTIQGTEFDDVSAFDNCGVVTKLVNEHSVGTLSGIELPIGENSITWYAVDDKGNRSEERFYVFVTDDQAPKLKTPEQGNVVYTSGACNAIVNYTPPEFIDYATDGVSPVTVSISPDWATPGETYPIGDTEVTYFATDVSGNSFPYTFNVTVIDNESPTITCPDPSLFTRDADAGKGYYTVTDNSFNPTYSDNCSVTLLNDFTNSNTLKGANFPIGTTIVTWTATDVSGNEQTCQITVTVEDKEDPIIRTCPDATVNETTDLSECYYEVAGAEYDPFGLDDNHDVLKITYQVGSDPEVGTDVNTSLAGAQIPVGDGDDATIVTWRLYDLSGNVSATCETTFNIVDDENPVIITISNQQRNVDPGMGYYTIVGADGWDPIAMDNCLVETLTYQIGSGEVVGTDNTTSIVGAQVPIGTHSINWEAKDPSGNTRSGSYLVTVIDNEYPSVTCNDISIDLDATGNYSLDQDDIDALTFGTNDPGGIANISVNPGTFSCSNVGDNTVTVTITDNNGNIATCDATVTVIDITPPVVLCSDLTIQLDVLGQAVIQASQLDNGSTDACGIKSVVASQTSFNCTNVGANTVTLSVTDVNDNVATCTSTVTVEDNVDPFAVCNPINVYLDGTGNYSLTLTDVDNISAGSDDNCDLIKAVTPNTFNCTEVGSNSVKLRVTDPQGNYDECNTTVTVVDSISPVVNCQDITIQLDETGKATISADDIDNGSTDNCAIATKVLDKTTFNCSNIGNDPLTNTVRLTVTDINGNSRTCSAIVTVEDVSQPDITCLVAGEQLVNTDNDQCTYTHGTTSWDATASDACATIQSLTYTLSGETSGTGTSLNGVVFQKGITTVEWKAVDGSGNEQTCSYTVNVQDNQIPNALCNDITIQLDASGNVSITANDIDLGSNDACGTVNLAASKTAFSCSDLGANTVTLTVTDESGNESTCDAVVTVEDVINPVASCKDITVQLDASGSATITGPDIDNGSSDICGIKSLVPSPSTFTCDDVGSPVSVTLTVTDNDDNVSTCTSTVTVEDNVNPQVVTQNISVSLDASGEATISALQLDGGSTDACGIQTRSIDITNFTCADLGANTVMLTVTDVNGNSASNTAVVTIVDDSKPVFSLCPINQAKTTDPDVCTYTHSDNDLNATATDNCSINSMTYELSGATETITGSNTTLNGQVFNKGTTTVTWTAKDGSNNSETCSFDMVVTDDQNPNAICITYTAALDSDGNVSVNPADIDNGSTDNCAITSYEISKDGTNYGSSVSFTCIDLGTPTVYLRVSDAAGLTDVCSVAITVADTIAPTVDTADRDVLTDAGVCTYTHGNSNWDITDNCDNTPTASYTLSGATSMVTSPNTTLNGQVFEKGTTSVRWAAADASGNSRVTVFDVVVSDDQIPEFTSCPSDISQFVASAGATSATVSGIAAPTYTDNCDVTKLTYEYSGATVLAPQVSEINTLSEDDFNVGTTTVTYTAYDDANNSETCVFSITVNVQDGAIIVDKSSIQTGEPDVPESFTVQLGSAPTGTVVIDVSSDNTTEGTVSVNQLTFDESNWNDPQTVTVTGVNDDVDDDDINYQIDLDINTSGTDDLSGYESASPIAISAVNVDDDTADIRVSEISNPTTEAGGTATFTIVLDTEPIADVSLTLSSSDDTEGDVTDPASKTVTFTTGNWDIPQTITVTGADDLFVDGNVSYTIVTSNATSSDPKYSGKVADDVTVVNNDNDSAGFVVTPLVINTSEDLTTATFTVVLTSQPAADGDNDNLVIVDVVSGDLTEGTVDLSQLTFNSSNWDQPQTVTVTGVDDAVVDGGITYEIQLTVDRGNTTDPVYADSGQVDDPDNVSVTNEDNDAATVSISDVTQLETNSGTTNFVFNVTQSNIEVIGSYTVSFYTQNGTAKTPTDYSANGGLVTFTGSANETQTITIVVNGDDAVEANETFSVVLNSVNSSGRDITIASGGKTAVGTITNDDNATLSINDVSISEGDSGTKLLTFNVTLDMAVEDGLTVDYTTVEGTAVSSSDYITNSGSLTFEGTQNEVETISVVINGDETIELDENFSIELSNIVPVSAPDGTISILDGTGVGTILNDDAAVLSIDDFEVDESAGTANFRIWLDKAVQGEFTVDFETSDNTAFATSDYSEIASTPLSFGDSNPMVQNVTVTILDGDIVEPTETLYGTVSNLVDALNQNIVLEGGGVTTQATGTINDNDNASIAIDDVTVDEDAGIATFTVTLSGTVQNDFTLNYSTQDNTAVNPSDYTAIANTELTFGGLNNNTQTFDVTIIENSIAEATEAYYINLTDLNKNDQVGVSISDNQGLGTINDNDQVDLELTAFTIIETDGSQIQNFRVSRNIASQSLLTLLFSTSDGTAKASGDYIVQSNTLVTLPANSTAEVNIPVTIAGDLIAEPQEQFSGMIIEDEYSNQQVNIVTPSAVATIDDNDIIQISLEDKTVTETDETQSIDYVVGTNIAAQHDVILSYSTSNGTAVDGNDFTAQSNTVITIPAGSTNVDIPVDVLGDMITEPQEAFSGAITLTNDNGQQVILAKDNATYTIDDNDPATLVLTGFDVDEDAGTADFTVTLSRNVQNEFKVDFATSDIADQAVAGNDYDAATKTFTFGATNDLVQTVTVTINEDTWVEPTESLLGTISNLITNNQDVTISTPTAISTITDNESASISINDPAAVEEDAGPIIFTVTLTGNIQDELTVDFTVNDVEAEAGSDYTDISGTVTFPAGSLSGTTQSISIDLIDGNTISEPTETFTVDLDNIINSGNASISKSQGVGTILDNDPITAINLTGFAETEGDVNISYNFIASMDIEAQESIVISFSTSSGSAISGTDFTAQSGVQYTILPGNKSVNIPVEVIGDLVVEQQENFSGTISLVDAMGQNVAIGTSTANSDINDDDKAIISITGLTVDESVGTAQFTIATSREIEEEVTLDFRTQDNTATSGVTDDYIAITTTQFIFGGTNEESQTIAVTINDDDWVEPTESLIGLLNNLSENSQNVVLLGEGVSTQSEIIITDNDAVTLSIDDVTRVELDEGETEEYVFTVTHDGKSTDGSFSVAYETNGINPISGADYIDKTGTITFSGATGETQTISITVNGDNIFEPDEQFTVDLSEGDFGGRNISFSDDSGLGTITNDDAAAVTIEDVSGAEDDGAITLTATLNRAVQGGFTVQVSTSDGTATTADSDYTAVSLQTLSFSGTEGETQAFTLSPTADTKLEGNETLTVSMSNLSSTSLGVDISDGAEVTITNDDAAAVTIEDVSGAEDDGAITLTATLSRAVQGGFTVQVGTSDGTATTADSDYTAISLQTLSFSGTEGETQAFTVSPTADTKLEGNETLTVSMSNLSSTTLGVDISDGAEVTITNDDAAAVTIEDVSGSEDDGAITLTATLNRAVQGGFTVQVGTSDGTATTADSDYTAVSLQTLSFSGTEGETQAFTVTPTADTKLEGNETLTVSMSNLSSTTLGVDISDGAEVTITNDDAAAVTIEDVSGSEDDGAITLTATLNRAVQGGFTVQVGTSDGTATTADSDYTAVSLQTLSFSGTEGETQAFTVTPTADTKLEGNETLTVSMSNLSSTTLGVDISDGAEVTITNDDAAAVTIEDVNGSEDDGAITLTATLNRAVQGGFTVQVGTSDGTATTADSDYTAVSLQTLSFSGTEGETQAFTVTPTADTKLEGNETLTVSMSNLSSTTLGVDISDGAEVTITNDDAAAVTIEDVSGSEDDGAITLTATLSRAVQGGFTVQVGTSDGTATTADSDYTAVSLQTLSFSGTEGETQAFTVTPTADTKLEGNETLTVSMSNLSSTTLGVDISDGAEVTITNDDAAAVTIEDVSGSEDDGAITLTATLNRAVQGGFTVQVGTSDGTATTADSDYTAVSLQTLSFSGTEGETQAFTVTPTADTKLEGNETLTVSMSNLSSTTLGVDISDGAEVTITNDDAAAVTIEDVSGSEDDGAITLTATLSRAVQGGFTVQVGRMARPPPPTVYTALSFSGTATRPSL